jgi:hypothetical protein
MAAKTKSTRTKYGKRIHTRKLIREIPHYTGKSIVAHDGELDEECSLGYHCISKPMSFDRPHSHDFPEMLCFIGGNALDITDFGAEIEFTLGGETHLITEPAVVSIPANVTHCPIKIRKVTKPIVFMEVSLSRIWKPSGPPPPKKKTAAAKKAAPAKKSAAAGKSVKKAVKKAAKK